MSDIFASRIKAERAKLEKLIADQSGNFEKAKQFSKLAKEFNLDTSDLDALIAVADGIFKSAGSAKKSG